MIVKCRSVVLRIAHQDLNVCVQSSEEMSSNHISSRFMPFLNLPLKKEKFAFLHFCVIYLYKETHIVHYMYLKTEYSRPYGS